VSPEEAIAEMIGIEPVNGVFFLPSGKTAVAREFRDGAIWFRSKEGRPPGDIVVAVDVSEEDKPPVLVGGMLVNDVKRYWVPAGNGLWHVTIDRMFAARAFLYEAIGCRICQKHPAPFRMTDKTWRCREHGQEPKSEAEAHPKSPSLFGW